MSTTTNIQSLVELRRALLDGTFRQQRQRAGLTLAEVARAAGVSPSALSRWEHGHRLPRTADALRLKGVLDVIQAVRRAAP